MANRRVLQDTHGMTNKKTARATSTAKPTARKRMRVVPARNGNGDRTRVMTSKTRWPDGEVDEQDDDDQDTGQEDSYDENDKNEKETDSDEEAIDDDSHQVPSRDLAATPVDSNPRTTRPAPKRRKQELDHLHAQHSELTSLVQETQQKHNESLKGASRWKRLATYESVRKQEALQENAQLREIIAKQRSMVDSIVKLLGKSKQTLSATTSELNR